MPKKANPPLNSENQTVVLFIMWLNMMITDVLICIFTYSKVYGGFQDQVLVKIKSKRA